MHRPVRAQSFCAQGMSSRYKHYDSKSIQEQRAHRTKHAVFMSLSTTCRVQVCPAAVLAAMAAGANEEAREQIPALLLADLAATTKGPPDECPTEATARLERWLCETRAGCVKRALAVWVQDARVENAGRSPACRGACRIRVAAGRNFQR